MAGVLINLGSDAHEPVLRRSLSAGLLLARDAEPTIEASIRREYMTVFIQLIFCAIAAVGVLICVGVILANSLRLV
jgi:hypothetical protein